MLHSWKYCASLLLSFLLPLFFLSSLVFMLHMIALRWFRADTTHVCTWDRSNTFVCQNNSSTSSKMNRTVQGSQVVERVVAALVEVEVSSLSKYFLPHNLYWDWFLSFTLPTSGGRGAPTRGTFLPYVFLPLRYLTSGIHVCLWLWTTGRGAVRGAITRGARGRGRGM